MNDNTEYCTREQAIELKKLGFNEPCRTSWVEDTSKYQALKWFREKHGLHGWVFRWSDPPIYMECFGYKIYKCGVTQTNDSFISPEQAESSLIDKLIEIVKANTNS